MLNARTFVCALSLWLLTGCATDGEIQDRQVQPGVKSSIETTATGGAIAKQEFEVEAPLEQVWQAFTTKEGYEAWAAPVAQVDLRAGGTILSHYTPTAAIGDPGTIRLNILNLIPRKLLTLQAELSENWPQIMKDDASNLMNVLLFEEMTPSQTRVISYGLGYTASAEMDELLGFFLPANEKLYEKLKATLER